MKIIILLTDFILGNQTRFTKLIKELTGRKIAQRRRRTTGIEQSRYVKEYFLNGYNVTMAVNLYQKKWIGGLTKIK